MTWTLVHTETRNPIKVNPFRVDHTFTQRFIIVGCFSPTAQTNWYRAGFIIPSFLIPEVGAVRGEKIPCELNTQWIRFDTFFPSYTFEFHAHDWISDLEIKFWETDDPVEVESHDHLDINLTIE